jgi:hypothetical protein
MKSSWFINFSVFQQMTFIFCKKPCGAYAPCLMVRGKYSYADVAAHEAARIAKNRNVNFISALNTC